jgi:YVTN family beta-propeller protein
VGTITGIPYPYDIAISPDGTRAYVVGYDYPSRYGALSRVDILTHRVIDSLALGNNLTCVAAGPDNSCIYVIKTGLDTLSPGLIVVDSTRFEVIANVAFSFNPFSVVISPDGSRAFVCGTEIHSAPHNGRLAIVDTATYKVLHTINLLQLNTVGIAINPEGSRVYITNANGDDGGTVSIVDTQNYSILDKIQVGSNPHEIVVSPDGSRVYTVRTSGDLLVVIDARTSTVIRYVPLGIGAWHLALSYDGQFLCASQWYLGSKIVIVDTTTFSVRTISVGRDPVGVAFSSDGTRVYVCKYLDSSVSVIARE